MSTKKNQKRDAPQTGMCQMVQARTQYLSVALLLTVAALLFLSGCDGSGGTITNFNKYQGTDGLTLSFLTGAPPKEVFEGRSIPMKLEIKDLGAFNVSYDRMLITFSYDTLYIKGEQTKFSPKDLDLDHTEILGRDYSYLNGQTLMYGIPSDVSFEAKQVMGEREAPQTDLTVSVCYPYKTFLANEICIDTNLYGENQRVQTCKSQDLTFASGQGSPIAITKIGVQSVPVISSDKKAEIIRPVFTIQLKNVGKGVLIGPDYLPMDTACLLKSIPKEALNAVTIQAFLLGTKLTCGQGALDDASGIIKMPGGEGQVTCTVPEDQLTNPIYRSTQNFQSMLIINLSYLYKSSASTTMTIKRIPGAQVEIPVDGTIGQYSGLMYNGNDLLRDANNNPITKCAYYGQRPAEAPSPFTNRITTEFSCSCGTEQCLSLSREGKCFAGLCPANTYCCNPNGQGTSASTDQGNRIANAALAELAKFPTGTTECKGTTVNPDVVSYYGAGGCSGTCSSAGASSQPWSGAFISYVLKNSGANFPASCSHFDYFTKIRDNPSSYSCKTYPPTQISQLKVGDIVCQCRDPGCPILYTTQIVSGRSYDGHCDIVTSIKGSNIEMVGGNVGNAVKKTTATLSKISNAPFYGFISCG